MSSSTNPPGKTRKFQFGVDFDLEEQRVEEVQHPEPDDIMPVHAAPSPQFSEEEIEEARKEAFQAGIDQGFAQAVQASNAQLTQVIDQAMNQMEILLEGETKRLMHAREIALRTTVATIKKIWPAVLQQYGLSLVEATIRQSMESNSEETRIVVRVHDTILDDVVNHLPQLQQQQAFAGKIIVLADPTVQAGDCKIEWADGGLERLSRAISSQVDDALERILANLSHYSQDTDTERK